MPAPSPLAPPPPGAGPFSSPAPGETGSNLNGPGDRRHLLGLEGMAPSEIRRLLEAAQWYRDRFDSSAEPTRECAGVTVCNAFFENSTRTRTSFELAESRLGATHVSFSSIDSSTAKGETFLDTLRVIEAMKVDLIVVRHPCSGTAATLARHLDAGVINAGDGRHEHPTQALLDLLTLRQTWGDGFAGRRVAIVGDIAHSRVARSAIHGLQALGVHVILAGPPTLVPPGIEALGTAVARNVEEAMDGADAVMALRLQRERMDQGLLPSVGEYARVWGVTARRVALMKPDAVVMHPGPMNREVEIASEVADSKRSVIFDQVSNGVAVRSAVLVRCAQALAA